MDSKAGAAIVMNPPTKDLLSEFEQMDTAEPPDSDKHLVFMIYAYRSYEAIPPTCGKLDKILTRFAEALAGVMMDKCGNVDSRVIQNVLLTLKDQYFREIRDQITDPFRTALINAMMEESDNESD